MDESPALVTSLAGPDDFGGASETRRLVLKALAELPRATLKAIEMRIWA